MPSVASFKFIIFRDFMVRESFTAGHLEKRELYFILCSVQKGRNGIGYGGGDWIRWWCRQWNTVVVFNVVEAMDHGGADSLSWKTQKAEVVEYPLLLIVDERMNDCFCGRRGRSLCLVDVVGRR